MNDELTFDTDPAIYMIVEEIDQALLDLPTSKVIDRFVMNDILLDLKSKILSRAETIDIEPAALDLQA